MGKLKREERDDGYVFKIALDLSLRHCNAQGCSTHTKHLICGQHWLLLPQKHLLELDRYYKPDTRHQSAHYKLAAVRALIYLALAEGKEPSPVFVRAEARLQAAAWA